MKFRPLFIFGVARSGTNLLARMLDRHPLIGIGLDPFMPVFKALRNATVAAFAPDGARRGFRSEAPFQDYYFDPAGVDLLDALLTAHAGLPLTSDQLDELRRRSAERAALESVELARGMVGLHGRDYGELLESLLDIIAGCRPGALWVGYKEVWVGDFVPLLARAFPEARFYAVERDPRAIVASLVAMTDRDVSQAAHVPSYARHWRKNIALARRFEGDADLGRRFRTISYERLVGDPEAEARRICEELEVEFTFDMLRVSADGWRGNSSYDHGGIDIYTGTAERWRKTLEPAAVRSIEFLCGPEMSLTEYAREAVERLDDGILRFLRQAGDRPCSWRSDNGDLIADVGGELLRYALLEMNEKPDASLVRRCFLFEETYEAIRRERRASELQPDRAYGEAKGE